VARGRAHEAAATAGTSRAVAKSAAEWHGREIADALGGGARHLQTKQSRSEQHGAAVMNSEYAPRKIVVGNVTCQEERTGSAVAAATAGLTMRESELPCKSGSVQARESCVMRRWRRVLERGGGEIQAAEHHTLAPNGLAP
jgi:hypothetical protein